MAQTQQTQNQQQLPQMHLPRMHLPRFQLPRFQMPGTQPPPQPSRVAQTTVNIATQSPAEEKHKLKGTALKNMRGLSITQIVMGVFCIIFGIVLLQVDDSRMSIIGYGIWCGIYFVIVGGVGLATVKYNTSSWITATMVLNIISSAIFFLLLLSLAAMALDVKFPFKYWCRTYPVNKCRFSSSVQATLALNSLLVIISVIQLIVTIWSSVLCCRVVCLCCLPTRSGYYMQNAASGQQQYVANQRVVPPHLVNSTEQVATAPTPAPQKPTCANAAQNQEPPAYEDLIHNSDYKQSPPTADPSEIK